MIGVKASRGRIAVESGRPVEALLGATAALVASKAETYGVVVLGLVSSPSGLQLLCTARHSDMGQRILADPVSWVGNYNNRTPPEDVESDVLEVLRQMRRKVP